MIWRFDSFLIDRIFQKVADVLWKIVSVSCYSIAMQLSIIYIISMYAAIGMSIADHKNNHTIIADAILLPMVLFIGWTTHRRCAKNEEKRLAGEMILSDARMHWLGCRIVWTLLLVIDLPLMLLSGDLTLNNCLYKVGMLSIWAAVYFEVCMGRPTSRLRKLVPAFQA